jgi:hypothetical protein
MKRTSIYLIPLLLAATGVFSRAIHQIGIKAGLSTADQSYRYHDASLLGPGSSLNRICIGGSVEWKVSRHINMLTEIFYIPKGSAYESVITSEAGPQPIGTGRWTYRIDYLSIPLTAKLMIHQEPWSVYGIIGPRMDIRLHQEDEWNDTGISDENMKTMYRRFRRIDFGADMGVGLERGIASYLNLSVEFRYSPSFSHVYQSDLLSIRNRCFEVLLGFGF